MPRRPTATAARGRLADYERRVEQDARAYADAHARLKDPGRKGYDDAKRYAEDRAVLLKVSRIYLAAERKAVALLETIEEES